jgi:photosynthetic reaction center cytochrome c subunit
MRLILTLALFLAVLAGQTPETPPKKSRPAPKNLQVLTVEEERPMMGGMRASLGVMCSHCHMQGDYASDENPKKLVARSMMTMTKEINAKFADGKQHVTCYTCHRGKTLPEMAPPPAAPAAAPAQ